MEIIGREVQAQCRFPMAGLRRARGGGGMTTHQSRLGHQAATKTPPGLPLNAEGYHQGYADASEAAQARTAALVEAAEDVLDCEWMGVTETYRPVEILIKSERLERLAEAIAAYRKGE